MGKVWPPEAVWKNVFTSPYGTIVSLSESPIKEGLIVIGTDDGQIQVTEDGGTSWTLFNRFPGIPDKAYVADVLTSHHDEEVIYAVFNNHKEGDFTPYILKSSDLGKNWESISNGIASSHTLWTIMEDHEQANLLFAGTEFGLYATVNGGGQWVQMKGGIPTIAVRDLEIQKREDDLVCATFGRGFWILDNYNPLRQLAATNEISGNVLFEMKDVWSYVTKGDKGYSEKGVFGDNFYRAANPPKGPVLNIYLDEKILTSKEERKKSDVTNDSTYPDYEQLKKEDFENKPKIYALIKDVSGNIISTVDVPNKVGFQRIEANLNSIIFGQDHEVKSNIPPLLSGSFTAQLYATQNGVTTTISDPQSFEVNQLLISEELPSEDYHSFSKQATKALVSVMELNKMVRAKLEKIEKGIDKAILENDHELILKLENERLQLLDLKNKIQGDQTRIKRFQYHHPGLLRRIRRVYNNLWDGTQITDTHRSELERVNAEVEAIRKGF